MAFVPSLYRPNAVQRKAQEGNTAIMKKDKLTSAAKAIEQAQEELDYLLGQVDAGRPIDTRLLRQHQSTVNHAAIYVHEAVRAKQRGSMPVYDLLTR